MLSSSIEEATDFWKPTEEELEQICNDDDDNGRPDEETISRIEQRLSNIYHMVPETLATPVLRNGFQQGEPKAC